MDMFHPPIERRYYPGIRSIYRGGENEFLPHFDPPMKFIPTTLIRSHRSRWRIEEKIYEDIPSSLPPTYAPVGSVELHRLKANLIRLKKRRKKKKRIKIGHTILSLLGAGKIGACSKQVTLRKIGRLEAGLKWLVLRRWARRKTDSRKNLAHPIGKATLF